MSIRNRLTPALARALGIAFMLLAVPAPAQTPAQAPAGKPDLRDLPARVAKYCGTPIEWLTVGGEDDIQLHLPTNSRSAPDPATDFAKVDCVIGQVRVQGGVKMGFTGNEMDPNLPLYPGWSLIAGGSIPALRTLVAEAGKAGWVVGSLAKADDGTGFLLFHTPDGMTYGQASPLVARLTKHEFGDITWGNPPSRDGGDTDGN